MKLTKEQINALALGLKNYKPKEPQTIKSKYLEMKKATQK